ncbi:MAG TPA: FtsX-like permease family protein, partial [Ignavibacteriales bacterium]|nr:FtsX-like permease family protein [Ignavibacteriales bacterium]
MAEKELPQIPNVKTGFKLQPLSDLHYNAKLRNYNFRVINKNVLFALGLIAALVIIAACINFINLSTAQAVKRSKEAGIKKTLGAGGFSLFSYFMTEVAVIVFSSAVLSIVIAELLTPYLSQVLDLKIEFNSYTDYQSLGFLLALSAVVIFIAGFYPSFLMSKSAPIASLKGGLTGGGNKSGLLLRRSLVVAQFVISQALIIGALVIGKQMEFFKNKDLGYDKDLIISTSLPEEGYKQKDYYIERLNSLPNVKSVSAALNPPSGVSSRWGTVVNPENDPDMPIRADMKPADINYVKTYNLKLLAGRDIRETDGFDRVVINESMMRKIGINNPNEALGFRLLYDDSLALEVVGVLKNFYLRSLLREKIEPMILFNAENSDLADFYANVGIKLKHYGSKEEMENTIKGIHLAYESAYPAEVFEYEFLDQALLKYYSDEERMSHIIRFFMSISVLIGCIGLYGLISFIAAQKTKEIGIRKVLGASVTGIVGLLSKEFIVLLGVSFVISWPAAYYLINKWLEDYPQRIDVGFGIFAAAAGIAIIISAATISYQAVKAATVNPVKSLKYE